MDGPDPFYYWETFPSLNLGKCKQANRLGRMQFEWSKSKYRMYDWVTGNDGYQQLISVCDPVIAQKGWKLDAVERGTDACVRIRAPALQCFLFDVWDEAAYWWFATPSQTSGVGRSRIPELVQSVPVVPQHSDHPSAYL